ncbi:MAG: hypothetical protein HC903_13440 [Methylacidiphilales bacterium]|nr:hypothetical protein [Candidatus Methylacidiphilales bacterium]
MVNQFSPDQATDKSLYFRDCETLKNQRISDKNNYLSWAKSKHQLITQGIRFIKNRNNLLPGTSRELIADSAASLHNSKYIQEENYTNPLLSKYSQVTNNFNSQQLDYLVFEVADTGLGISLEEIETLFNPFVQTDVGRESTEGTGLGLAISREYVKLLGGDIRVSSLPNQGSILVLILNIVLQLLVK